MLSNHLTFCFLSFFSLASFLFHYLSFFFLSLFKNCSQSFHIDMLINEAQGGISANFVTTLLHSLWFQASFAEKMLNWNNIFSTCDSSSQGPSVIMRCWLNLNELNACRELGGRVWNFIWPSVAPVFVYSAFLFQGKSVSCLMVYPFHHLISPCPSRPG